MGDDDLLCSRNAHDRNEGERKGSDPLGSPRILTGTSRISPEMALRLSKALGRSPESWLAMQSNYDLWQAKQHVKLGKVRLTAA